MRALLLLALVTPSALAAQPTKKLSDEDRGKQLWERHCTACHGPGNRGDGPATEALVASVPDLRGKVKAEEPTIKVVLRGRSSMPGYEATFDRADARRVLAYMAKVHKVGSTQKPAEKKTEVEEAPPDDAQGQVPDEE